MELARTGKLPTNTLRYSLSAMFEYVTICAGICALIPVIGTWSATCLMLTALAIVARQGELALVGLVIAVVFDPFVNSMSFAGQSLTIATTAGLALWFRWRFPLEPDADCAK